MIHPTASTSIAAAAMSGDGTTDNLLLPGDMVLSKDAILKALAKPSVWGVGNKKRAVLLALVTNRDALLDRVGEASQDQRATLEKLIPIAEKTVRNPRFKVVKVVEHIYEIAIILDAYHSSPFSRAMRSDPLNQTFANISSMMRQARQDAETTLLDEPNSSRVKLSCSLCFYQFSITRFAQSCFLPTQLWQQFSSNFGR
jgi:hypothetical protein